ncbi:hypothetical protein L249_5477 [Ophiocordyceps polyrhachis-furcata BCC 54312]|uniref:Protein BIG1 n=1 Tax=Ophiocordyceps polyrhachis-furcata BCC 54312 TaxID=1330021 RepID=A0A367LGJ9_9HYPO|nr:hypothetical protein L249_5477 [Ophiocordyceps polyrhachis-furcata BCC 54312]
MHNLKAALLDSFRFQSTSTQFEFRECIFVRRSFHDAVNRDQYQTTAEALKYTRDFLGTCSTDRYLVASQPGIRASDFRAGDCAMPRLCRAVARPRIQSEFSVAEVVGNTEYSAFAQYIESECTKKGKSVIVDEVRLPPLSLDDRAGDLLKHDSILFEKLEALTKSDSYTILFLSRPGEPAYQAEFIDTIHQDLKRDLEPELVRREENNTEWDRLPLLEKYQFFTPGIFMGIIVAIVLFSILGVGLKALASLEVSYGAFEKEMGPAGHKKQQ